MWPVQRSSQHGLGVEETRGGAQLEQVGDVTRVAAGQGSDAPQPMSHRVRVQDQHLRSSRHVHVRVHVREDGGAEHFVLEDAADPRGDETFRGFTR